MRFLDEWKYKPNLVYVPKMAANMYRVGDCVFFETSSTAPYQIRRIEELNKNPTGNVEAKVMCFYRRRDISSSLVMLADKHQSALEEESDELAKEEELLSGKQRHQLKHRELFLSRQVETLPATHIRGKCTVTLLNETESLLAYLNKEDAFFYSLVYDPQQKTLLADKGEIRVGNKYQVEHIPDVLASPDEETRKEEELEKLCWTTCHPLTDKQIDQFLVISRSVGTFARALDCSSSVKQPSLHMSAAAASRDITLFHAMDILHQSEYDLSSSMAALVPSSGPMLCRDQMEEWTASEANLFEEALEKYGKDFNDIKQDFLPWKSLTSIIEYYYMWKTTDRYVQQKRVKAVEQESKLKQVYIPNYNKPNPAQLTTKGMVNGTDGPVDGLLESGKACESCGSVNSVSWYSWGPAALACRLCQQCWYYWKKYAGLKAPSKFLPEELEGGYSEPGALAGLGADGDGHYTCRECSKVFTRQERLLQHMASHRGHPYRCHVNSCGKEFKLKTHLVRHCASIHGVMVRGGSPRPTNLKTRTAFYLHTTPLTRLSRRLMHVALNPRHAARQPFWPVNSMLIKQECHEKLTGLSPSQISKLVASTRRKRKKRKVYDILTKLGGRVLPTPQFLLPTERSRLPPEPINPAFPRPPKRKDGSLIYDPVPCKEVSSSPAPPPPLSTGPTINNVSPSLLKRKNYEEHNGIDGQISKRPSIRPNMGKSASPGSEMYPGMMIPTAVTNPNPHRLHHVNGRSKIGGRKHVISWVDAPDDVYFHATPPTKRFRRQMSMSELRRAARRPWRKLNVRAPQQDSLLLCD